MLAKFEKIFNSNRVKCFLIFLGIYSFTFILFMNRVYTSDHVYSSFSPTTVGEFKDYLSGGRFISYFIAIFYYILSLFGINHIQNQWFLQSILIFFLALASAELYKMYAEEDESVLDYKLIALLTLNFINPFFVEHFVYKGAELGVAIWIVTIAVQVFYKKKYIWAFILAFIATGIYQSYIILFLIYATGVWFFRYNSNPHRKMVWDYCKILLTAAAVAFCNIFIVKLSVKTGVIEGEIKKTELITNSDAGVIGGLLQKLQNVMETGKTIMLSTWNMLPQKFFIGSILLFVLLVVFYMLICHRKISNILLYLFTILIIHAYPFSIAMVMGSIYLPQRVIWPIFASCSIGLIIAYKCLKDSWAIKPYICIAVVFGVVVFFNTQNSILDLFISNALDWYYAEAVQEEIREYEEESGCEVTDVYAIHARDAKYCHYQLMHFDYTVTYNRKIQNQIWSDVEWLNLVNDEDYIKHTIDNTCQDEYFKESTAEVFNASEQLYFEGNNMYWLIY